MIFRTCTVASWRLYVPSGKRNEVSCCGRRRAGFHHSDLRLANVMEVLPEEDNEAADKGNNTRPTSGRLLR